MDLQQAKRLLEEAGYEGEPTVAILKQLGWKPVNPLAGLSPSVPFESSEEIRDNIALLMEEMKAAGVAENIIKNTLDLIQRIVLHRAAPIT